MRTISIAVAALITESSAITQKTAGAPDVYGPNGTDYDNVDAVYDLSRIGIDVLSRDSAVRTGDGKQCRVGDWTTVHWVATLPDGRVVSDSRAEPGGLPKTFALGAHEVFSCWDFAIPKLWSGDKVRLHCPSYYAWGGAYTWAPLGGEPIPLNSDVNFDIEVTECNRTPDFTDYYKQPKTTTMQPSKCMRLHLAESDSTGNDMVLTSQEGDVIVHNKQSGDDSQWWSWNEDDHTITNVATGKKLADNSGDAALNDKGSEWWYDQESSTLRTKVAAYTEERNDWVMSKYLTVPKEKLMPGSEVDVLMARAAESANSHWRIEYCDIHLRK
jgi:hypothetical protein